MVKGGKRLRRIAMRWAPGLHRGRLKNQRDIEAEKNKKSFRSQYSSFKV